LEDDSALRNALGFTPSPAQCQATRRNPCPRRRSRSSSSAACPTNSYAEATKNAVAKASETLRNLDWFEVVNQRGVIKNGKVAEFQVVLKVGFRLESSKAAD
jgi:dodecin